MILLEMLLFSFGLYGSFRFATGFFDTPAPRKICLGRVQKYFYLFLKSEILLIFEMENMQVLVDP